MLLVLFAWLHYATATVGVRTAQTIPHGYLGYPEPRAEDLVCLSPLDFSGTSLQDIGNWRKCVASEKRQYCLLYEELSNNTNSKPVVAGMVGLCALKEVKINKTYNFNCSAKVMADTIQYVINDFGAANTSRYHKYIPKSLVAFREYIKKYNYTTDPVMFCQNPPPTRKLDGAGWFVFILLLTLATLVVIGALIELGKWYMSLNKQPDDSEQLLIQAAPAKKEKTAVDKVLSVFECWSPRHNFGRLMQPVPGGTACLNGMRVISMFWIILGHTMYIPFELTSYTNLQEIYDKIGISGSFILVNPAFFAVDSFFWLSGFLTSFMLIKEFNKLQERGKMPRNILQKIGFWFIFYFHRYFRLTPVYAVLLLFDWKILPRLGSGPYWGLIPIGNETTCDKYWWTNLVYINNLYPWKEANMCMEWGWYMANDFQFFCLVPIIITLYRFNKKVGAAFCVVLMVVSWFLTGYFYAKGLDDHHVVKLTGRATGVYTKPYIRIPAYLWGILAGFFMHYITPDIETYTNDDILDRMNGTQIKIRNYLENRWFRWMLFSVGAILLMLIMFFDWDSVHDFHTTHPWSNAAFVANAVFAKIGWGLGLSIIFCLYSLGYGGLPNKMLAHAGWAPMARLTYGAYLCHPILMIAYYGTLQDMPYFGRWFFFIRFCAFALAAYCVSAATFLGVEKPFMNLERFVLPGKH